MTILMNKRDEKDIWANMYDLPLIETFTYTSPEDVVTSLEAKAIFGNDIQIVKTFAVKKHLLTHQHLHTQFIRVANKPVKLKQEWFYIDVKDVWKLAFPKIIAIFLNNFFSL